MLAVCHHPLLSPVKFYRAFSPHEMIEDCDRVAELLADSGVRYLFTGHTHMQSINYYYSTCGNRLYEINTGCITAYPSPIRRLELDDSGALTVKTEHIKTMAHDMQCKPYMTYLKEHFARQHEVEFLPFVAVQVVILFSRHTHHEKGFRLFVLEGVSEMAVVIGAFFFYKEFLPFSHHRAVAEFG